MLTRVIFLLALAAPVAAQTAKNDYSDGKSWRCRPGRQAACAVDQTTTIVAADGTLTREEWNAHPGAPIDCFYVYPTVSTDSGGNSDMIAGAEENGVVRAQLARFASQCRVLSNADAPADRDDIGRHLLDAESSLLVPQAAPKTRTEIAVDPQLFERYVGRYQLAPAAIVTITRDGAHLFEQLTGQPKVEIFPESDKEFFLKVVDAQITFETNSEGKATALVLHQMGRDQRAPRIEGEPVTPTEITLDPKVFDGYVGRYQVTPTVTMTITREDTHFFTQIVGQPSIEIFASGERQFFLKVVDAQITFETDSQGRATVLVLRQNGRDLRGPRIDD
jgi:uncharacterized pyridoxamine 5'-phosphate oxidase family protein